MGYTIQSNRSIIRGKSFHDKPQMA